MLADMATTPGMVKNEALEVRYASKTRMFIISTYQTIFDVGTGNVAPTKSRP